MHNMRITGKLYGIDEWNSSRFSFQTILIYAQFTPIQPADKPDGPGRDAASAFASSVWTANWNSVCEKVAVVAVEAGTDVAAGEPMGNVAPEDDMTIDD